MYRIGSVVLTAWAGSLWTVCGLVVPLLFATLDRQLAGNIATTFFHAEVGVSAVLGIAFLVLRYRSSALDRSTGWLAGVAIAAPLIFYGALRPLMNAARTVGDMARFGMLHSVAGGLFLVACVAALVLVVREAATRRAR